MPGNGKEIPAGGPFSQPGPGDEAAGSCLGPGERLDDLQTGGFHIIQNPGLFCFGMDAVLLSSFAKAFPGEKVLDLGTGNGVIPILMRAKGECRSFTGLEINPVSADMAERSIRLNALEGDIRIICGDLKEAGQIFAAASFHTVTCNPPYMICGKGIQSPNPMVAAARHEVLCSLEDVVKAAAWVLKDHGRFYMVHRPFRLAQIIRTLSAFRLEPKRMRLVYPSVKKEPNMVLIESMKGAGSGMIIEPPLIVYREKGVYTEELLQMYGMGENNRPCPES